MDREVMTREEVAAYFGVNGRTVTRWAQDGKLSCFRTAGGHRRYDRRDVERLRESMRDK